MSHYYLLTILSHHNKENDANKISLLVNNKICATILPIHQVHDHRHHHGRRHHGCIAAVTIVAVVLSQLSSLQMHRCSCIAAVIIVTVMLSLSLSSHHCRHHSHRIVTMSWLCHLHHRIIVLSLCHLCRHIGCCYQP